MPVRLSGRIKQSLADSFAARAKSKSLSMTKALKMAVEAWLAAHEGKMDLNDEDGRQKRGETWNMNIDVPAVFKKRIDVEVERRKNITPRRFPASVVDLVEEAMRDWLK